MKKSAQFYFANLGADVVRCVVAAEAGDEGRYESSLERARRTLAHLHDTRRLEAYEEGVRMIQALEYARAVEEAILRMEMKVNKIGVCHLCQQL